MAQESLFKLQLGPVQDFIAAARSTRDLWSGSYLLSWLMAAGIRALPDTATLIFPNRKLPDGSFQPLLDGVLDPDASNLLIPNLPNLFVAKVQDDATSSAKAVENAIRMEWEAISDAVWKRCEENRIVSSAHQARFKAQVDRHLSITWLVTPLRDDYATVYRTNGWYLDAVRQTRDFIAWDSATPEGCLHHDCHEKDSLTGRAEAIVGGGDFMTRMRRANHELQSLFSKHADHLSAVSLIKRCWHLAYLRDERKLKTASRQFVIRSIPAIAAYSDKLDDDENQSDSASSEKYIAAIAFDGDQIGKWVSGEAMPAGTDLEIHHSAFSAALSKFAMGVQDIVERKVVASNGKRFPVGQLIYAGGDDVVALVPADAALEIAKQLRESFREMTSQIRGEEASPDGSAGIAIGHVQSPLQDLIHEAQNAEKRAKSVVGRPAFSITLMKRSGEILHWGSQWDSGGLDLYQRIAELMDKGDLSTKFPHRVIQLLTPYFTNATGLMQEKSGDVMTDASDFSVDEHIKREFEFAIQRQSTSGVASANSAALLPLLKDFLTRLSLAPRTAVASISLVQRKLTAITGLCTAVAFAHRTRPDRPHDESGENSTLAQSHLSLT